MSTLLTVLTCGLLLCGTQPGGAVPGAIAVATTRGETLVPVSLERGHATLPLPTLARVLPLSADLGEEWVIVHLAREPFRFLLDAPVLIHQARVIPLVGGAYVVRDTVFVPLQWLTDYVPRVFREAYRYDPLAARFEETRLAPVVTAAAPAAQSRHRAAKPGSRAAENGFRLQHKIVLDPGHGGRDGGNPGLHFPRGIKEKHVTLSLAKAVRDELLLRGVEAVMTRTRDTLIDLRDRAPLCRDDCALFVSVHVNSLPRRRGYQNVNGVETYFLGEGRTAEAARVAQMENEAVRYETGTTLEAGNPLTFIFKDLHTNEYLRESALLADLVQRSAARVHPGLNRGVAQHDGFVVLLAARRPAILLEAGFSTNRRDARFLASEDGQRRLAGAVADGIEEYLHRYEAKILAGSAP